MKGPAKICIYLLLIGAVCALVYAFGAERSRVLHQAAGASRGRMMAWLGSFILAAIVLGVLVAYDVAHFFGRRAERVVLQGGPPLDTPGELAQADRLRVAGQPLEGVRRLREFLQQHPKEYEVMARIAEIYSKDLNQPLSAALEYEELLKHRLPADQWAWGALHLAKLYGRLDQPEKSVEMLERIVNEHGRTVPATRARKALAELRQGQAPEPSEEDES